MKTSTWYRFATCLAISLNMGIFSVAHADEEIQFPEDELSQETVLPHFDRPDVVRGRNIVTAKKFELAPFIGFVSSEPIYSQTKMGFNLAYHWNEESAVSLNFAKYNGGLNTQYTDSLRASYQLDFSRAPKQNYAAFMNYEYKAYYGKISLTKQGVMNLSTYPLVGIGVIAFEHKTYTGLDFGIGQKFYFTKSFGLRFDLKFQYAQAPSPFLQGRMKPTEPTPQPGDFTDKWALNNLIDLGFTFIF